MVISMAKDEQTNQLNLTVVALVALVAIVGLVALVMNAASFKTAQLATGSQLASADNAANENVAGMMRARGDDCGAGIKKCSSGSDCGSGFCVQGCCM